MKLEFYSCMRGRRSCSCCPHPKPNPTASQHPQVIEELHVRRALGPAERAVVEEQVLAGRAEGARPHAVEALDLVGAHVGEVRVLESLCPQLLVRFGQRVRVGRDEGVEVLDEVLVLVG